MANLGAISAYPRVVPPATALNVNADGDAPTKISVASPLPQEGGGSATPVTRAYGFVA